ncbi:MAG: VanW family protein [Clostridia bacterium]|nr:VanW family protein [Clostridia bacterium]
MYYQQGYRPPQEDPLSPPRRRRRKIKPWLIYALCALLIGLIIAVIVIAGIRMTERSQRKQELHDQVDAYQHVFLPNIIVDGVDIGGMSYDQARDAVMAQVNARQNSWTLDLTYQFHVFFTLNYAALGIETDLNQVDTLLNDLYRLGKPANDSEQAYEQSRAEIQAALAEPTYAFTTQSDMSDALLDSVLAQIRDQLAKEPADAYLAYFSPDHKDPFIIQPESYGASLDVEEAKRKILEMAAEGKSGFYEMVPTPIAPQVSQADVRSQVSLLYKAITPISSSSTTYRTQNIRTAFSRVNGKTLAPGEVFSFNDTILKRTEKNGYKPAIEYGEGGMEQVGIGGGVCQASTTVYLAAIQSGLEILERHAHGNTVSYTTFGQDATVNDGRLDMRFRNTSGGTIYITAHVEEVKRNKFQCVVCFYGPSLGTVSYSLRTETVETIPAPLDITYQKDKNHVYVTYKDEEPVLVREARDGFINETYLQKWDNGSLASETAVSRDECKARNTVYAVGTLDR